LVCHVDSVNLDNLVSDFSRFYILTILYEGSTHGYGIINKFQKRVGKSISPGLVYPFLQTLEGKGLLSHLTEMVGEKEKKTYTLTEEGRRLCHRLFGRFAGILSTAIEPSLNVCAHCGCKTYEGGHREIIDGVETTFCCIHCANSYRGNTPTEGTAHIDTPITLVEEESR
jgi:DNA-binding PadR family transcriptional regulator